MVIAYTEPLRQIKKSKQIKSNHLLIEQNLNNIIGKLLRRSTFVSLNEWSIHLCMGFVYLSLARIKCSIVQYLEFVEIYILNGKHNRVFRRPTRTRARTAYRTEIKCVIK